MAFELPDYVAWNDRFLRDIVPLQLCRAVIEFLTENGVTEPPLRRGKTNRSEVANDSSYQDVEWLPSIKRWLPGGWADAHIADKAVKSDDSPVDFRPWHRRIQLIFPCRISTLGVFERLCMRRWRSNACNSLFLYLSRTYGSSWRDRFCRGGKRTLRDVSSTVDKRARPIHGNSTSETSSGGDKGFVDHNYGRRWLLWTTEVRFLERHEGVGSSSTINVVGMDPWFGTNILAVGRLGANH